MKTYIGVKLIQAEPAQKHTCTTADCAEGIEGYKVVYSQPDGSTYESWSPKEVFEEAYTEVSLDTQLMREKVSEIISLVNKKAKLSLPQSYLWMLLDELENNNFTFKKEIK